MRLKTDVWLPLPVDRVFEFFSRAENLQTLTPEWLRFQILSPAPIEMRQGTVIDYRIRLRGLPMTWRSEITEWDPPRTFVDVQRRGPYRQWVHTHRFFARDGGTVVEDSVNFDMPGGRLVGWYVARDLRKIFTYRHDALLLAFGLPPSVTPEIRIADGGGWPHRCKDCYRWRRMPFSTLVDPSTLFATLDDPALRVVDCRFDLNAPSWGEREYALAHVPGAVYAHLDRDLSGTKTGANGRHPLPEPTDLTATLGRLGISAGVQVIAYDQDTGMYASRLWWLLRWMGHRHVAVLSGGFSAWCEEGRPARAGIEVAAQRPFVGSPDASQIADVDVVAGVVRGTAPGHLLDARAPERFRGDIEPIDRMPGHIPGASNHFFKSNLDATGRFLAPEALRVQLETELGATTPDHVIAYCGSGVTACHNLLALEHAGLTGGRLYPGSWSEWSSDERRPVATGDA